MGRNTDPEVRKALARAVDGERISAEEGLLLFERASLRELGRAADAVRRRLHPDGVVTYIIDRNVNYTNVCDTYCKFCAFYRTEGDPEAYVLSREELSRKIEETKALGGRQILMQGGNHPSLPIEWYEDLIRFIVGHGIHLHGFSPSEIQTVARVSDLTIAETIRRMREAGLGTIPGGGAEILTERVRRRISPLKTKTDEWLGVMREAHRQGMRSTATMMFGHREELTDRVEHLIRLRDLQDETGGFTAFIVWTFQQENTKIDVPPAGSHDYLRTLAVSRLLLDNFENLQSSWVTQGGQVGQLALFFGANDMGSTMIEENVVSAAGTVHALDEPGIRRLVWDAGFVPRRRNVYYELLPEPEGEAVGAAP
jgi:cyclic dehypoxanthinyl futalosine synthase